MTDVQMVRSAEAADVRRTEHAEARDRQSRDRMIGAYLPLARKLAWRYRGGAEPLDDLVQVAYLGLVKAVDRFDPSLSGSFAAFAIPTITGELRRHFRDHTWTVHVARGVQEDTLSVRIATTGLTETLRRAPSVRELADATGLDSERVLDAMQASVSHEPDSLDRPLGAGDGSTTTLAALLGGEDPGYELIEDRVTIAPRLRALSKRDRELLFLRFGHELTQTQIGQRLGCSQMQVSRLLRQALDRLAQDTNS